MIGHAWAAAVAATLVAAVATVSASTPADAAVAPPRIEVTRGVELAARCPPGYRRHTITAKCVRRQPRFPLLGWF